MYFQKKRRNGWGWEGLGQGMGGGRGGSSRTWGQREAVFGGENQEFGDSKRTGVGVWESWRVVRLLHAQSRFTLHQAAANAHKRTHTHIHPHKRPVSLTDVSNFFSWSRKDVWTFKWRFLWGRKTLRGEDDSGGALTVHTGSTLKAEMCF